MQRAAPMIARSVRAAPRLWHSRARLITMPGMPRLDLIARRTAAGALSAATAVALCAGAASASGLPERFDASFVLSADGIEVGQTRWLLEPAGDGRYLYRSHSETVGIAKLMRHERIEERSEWRFDDTGRVQPLHYAYSRSGDRRARNVSVEFDWDDGRVLNTLNGHTWSMELKRGTLDKLVYLLALMHDLSEGARATRYAIADGGRLKQYQLVVVGEERIDTVLGPLEALVVERRRDGEEEGTTRVWCAPALRFLPVQVEHREEDGVVRLTLTRIEGIAPPR